MPTLQLKTSTSWFNRFMYYSTQVLAVYAGFANIRESFAASLDSQVCFAPQEMSPFHYAMAIVPICAPQDEIFYTDLNNTLTTTAGKYGVTNNWLTAARNEKEIEFNAIVQRKYLRSTIRENELINLSLTYDLATIDFLQRQNLTPTRKTIINFLKKWRLAEKDGLLHFGLTKQFEDSYDLLHGIVPTRQLTGNAEVMNQAVKSQNEYVVAKILAEDYDLYLTEDSSGELPAYVACAFPGKFSICDLFLAHDFNPALSPDPKTTQYFIRLLDYKIRNLDKNDNLNFLLQWINSEHSKEFFSVLAKEDSAKQILQQLQAMAENKLFSRTTYSLSLGKMLYDNPTSLILAFLAGLILFAFENKPLAVLAYVVSNYLPHLPKSLISKGKKPTLIKKPKVTPPVITDPILAKILQAQKVKAATKRSFYSYLMKVVNNLFHVPSNKQKIAMTQVSIVPSEEFGDERLDVVVNNTKRLKIHRPSHKPITVPLINAVARKPKIKYQAIKRINTEDLTQFQFFAAAQPDNLADRIEEKQHDSGSNPADFQAAEVGSSSISAAPTPVLDSPATDPLPAKPELISNPSLPPKSTHNYVVLAVNQLPMEALLLALHMQDGVSLDLFVGGILRDAISNIVYMTIEDPERLADLDMVTNKSSAQVEAKFPNVYQCKSGAYRTQVINGQILARQIDIFQSAFFTSNKDIDQAMKADAATRPFTIDKIYAELKDGQWFLYDPTGKAFNDVLQRVIRIDEDPETVLQKDPLIILRAYYYAKEKHYQIDESLLPVIERNKHLIIELKVGKLIAFIHKLDQARAKLEIWHEFDELGISRYIWNAVSHIPEMAAIIRPLRQALDAKLNLAMQPVYAPSFFGHFRYGFSMNNPIPDAPLPNASARYRH